MLNRDHSVRGYIERCSTEEIKQVLMDKGKKYDAAVLHTARCVLLKRKKLSLRRCRIKNIN